MTTKHYATRRGSPFQAVRWSGEMTPEVRDLVGDHAPHVDDQGQLFLDNGRFVRVGEWIQGPQLVPVDNEQFRRLNEEVDEAGRPVSPTDEEHEAAGTAFVQALDSLLVEGLRLSAGDHSSIFRERDVLVRRLRHLLEDHAYVAERRERARIRERIAQEICKELGR